MAPQGDSTNAKQQIAGRINQATNILVAVSANPSIDALSSALATALTLNKLDKHATAVFSGQVPAVMQFLNPEKTFENNVDSLRDFIISLDKEKADRLRYKLEKDVVKIFITPYRTTITQDDLQFSQGDFNVDLVIALGVEKREDLDQAIIAHGRILHDATVVTINAGGQQSSLGAINWNDPNSSSLGEMLVSLIEALQKPGLLDAQIANALLTALVAATDRFSNQHTTPRVMTMAAQLMAAGANQQLVSVNIQNTGQAVTQIDESGAQDQESEVGQDGELSIKHPEEDKKEDKAEPGDAGATEKLAESEPKEEPQDTSKAEAELEAALPKPEQADTNKQLDELSAELESAVKEGEAQEESKENKGVEESKPESHAERKFVDEPPTSESQQGALYTSNDEPRVADVKSANSWRGHRLEPPTLGGSLSSTSEQALEDQQRSEEDQRNRMLLSHDGSSDEAATGDATQQPPSSLEPQAPSGDTMAQDALNDAHKAIDSQPYDPAGSPRQDLGAQPALEKSDVQPYIPIDNGQAQPAPAADSNGLPVIPPMPPLPVVDPSSNGNTNMPPMPPPLPPLPGEQSPAAPPMPGLDPNQPQSNDPGQFKIPN